MLVFRVPSHEEGKPRSVVDSITDRFDIAGLKTAIWRGTNCGNGRMHVVDHQKKIRRRLYYGEIGLHPESSATAASPLKTSNHLGLGEARAGPGRSCMQHLVRWL